jgi:hypothetical protein
LPKYWLKLLVLRHRHVEILIAQRKHSFFALVFISHTTTLSIDWSESRVAIKTAADPDNRIDRCRESQKLDRAYVLCLRTLWAFADFELNSLILFQGLESINLNS